VVGRYVGKRGDVNGRRVEDAPRLAVAVEDDPVVARLW
jgi:hypothetical protein